MMRMLRRLLVAIAAALAASGAFAATEAGIAELARQAAGAMAPARLEL